MFVFILLNGFLLVSTYLAGCIPISFNLSAGKLRVLTVFSAGLLLGAALTVIIPEGFDTLYQSQVSNRVSAGSAPNKSLLRNHGIIGDSVKRVARSASSAALGKDPDVKLHADPPVHDSDAHHHHYPLSTHQQTGLALLIGYLFMLLIDQLTDSLLASVLCSSTLSYCCLSHRQCGCLKRRRTNTCPMTSGASSAASSTTPNSGLGGQQSTNRPAVGTTGSTLSTSGHPPRMTATIGLIFHSFADGLALGAAFAIDRLQIEAVLFLAIFLHKLPASFGLACYLIHEGFHRDQIRAHMACFSAASPLAALCTYTFLVLSQDTTTSGEASSATMWRTGIALLLSGGTFLYVAASHILPDLVVHSSQANRPGGVVKSSLGSDPLITSSSVSTDAMGVGGAELHKPSDYPTAHYTMGGSHGPLVVYSTGKDVHPHDGQPRLSGLDLVVLLIGSLVPIIVSLGHSH